MRIEDSLNTYPALSFPCPAEHQSTKKQCLSAGFLYPLLLATTITLYFGIGAVCLAEEKAKLPQIKSLTILPTYVGKESSQKVAEVIGLFMEKAGVENIEIAKTAFEPVSHTHLAEIEKSLGGHISKNPVATDYVLYGEFIGTPDTGVQEIRTLLADKSGKVVWSDSQTSKDAEFQQAKPKEIMDCCVFLSKRLSAKFGLADPLRKNAPKGKMATLWDRESGIPSVPALEAMKKRTEHCKATFSKATIMIYPVIVGKQNDLETAKTLATLLKDKCAATAQITETTLAFTIPGNSNEQRVLWDTARAFQAEVKKQKPNADYALCAHYIMDASKAGAVHFIVCDRQGEWVIVDYQNSHHPDFQKINPKTPEDCNRLLAERFLTYIK